MSCQNLKSWLCALAWLCLQPLAQADGLDLKLRYQVPIEEGASQFHRLERNETWQAEKTALIICDMWDAHHCVNAVRRVNELAPRIDQLARTLRAQGATIVHAPSSCMGHYSEHAARQRAIAAPTSSNLPAEINSWCDQIPSEELRDYPLDQSAGGEDDEPAEHKLWADRLTAMGRNPKTPWITQCERIFIDDQTDFISDSGSEIWSILEDRNVEQVILVGVHTNMCVLGRPFGLRRLASNGKKVVLCRDLTDTMYDPKAWPYANHFTGNDLIVSHIERHVCPTISSEQILGGAEWRFSEDKRVRLAMLVAEDEYRTGVTLPDFAARHLSQRFSVTNMFGNNEQRNDIVGLEQIATADALLVSVRRRALPAADLQLIRDFVAAGKPMIGIRTASHAFSVKDKVDPSLAMWPEFDAQVWGGNYSNHFGNDLKATLEADPTGHMHPIFVACNLHNLNLTPGGSLYKTSPLLPGTQTLLFGQVDSQQIQPVAWTFVRNDGGRSFYTSLGHEADFEQPQFQTLLAAGICWACGLEPDSLDEAELQNQRFANGRGRQQ